MRKIAVSVLLLVAAIGGVSAAIAIAAGPSTGTVSACATVSVPDHMVGVDGQPVDTISGTTTSSCSTQTYTIPTSTSTATVTVTDTPTSSTSTTTPTTTTSSTTSTSSSSSSTSTTSTTPPPPPPTGCTVTESSLANVNADLGTPGAVVCLAAATYGTASISASPSAQSTLTAVPGAHVILGGVRLTGSHITVSQLHITGGVEINAGSNDTIDHDDITNAGCGYGVGVFGTYTGSSFSPVAANDTVSNSKIHDTGVSCEADALRIQGFKNFTATHNEEYNIADPNQLHTDILQSYQAGVATSGLTYTDNYVHDIANAGPPFIKDGDVQNVTITDNLVVRNSWTGIGGMDLHENTTGLVFRNNTYLGTSGTVVQGQGSAANPSLLFDHNVMDNANTSGSTGYTITSDYNDFVGNDEFAWALGPHDTTGAPAGGYVCGSSCGNGTAAGDDYELASNPNGIGIDWNPAAQQFGPGA